jgi:hypothetical protein
MQLDKPGARLDEPDPKVTQHEDKKVHMHIHWQLADSQSTIERTEGKEFYCYKTKLVSYRTGSYELNGHNNFSRQGRIYYLPASEWGRGRKKGQTHLAMRALDNCELES